MSINSWGFYEVSWPKATPIDRDWLCKGEPEDVIGCPSLCFVSREFNGIYSTHALADMIEMFGRPLDKVEGLELHCVFCCNEDEYFECHLDILDGKVYYEESKVVFEDKDASECPIDIGH